MDDQDILKRIGQLAGKVALQSRDFDISLM